MPIWAILTISFGAVLFVILTGGIPIMYLIHEDEELQKIIEQSYPSLEDILRKEE